MAVEDSLFRYLRLCLLSMYVKAAKITSTNVSTSNVSLCRVTAFFSASFSFIEILPVCFSSFGFSLLFLPFFHHLLLEIE